MSKNLFMNQEMALHQHHSVLEREVACSNSPPLRRRTPPLGLPTLCGNVLTRTQICTDNLPFVLTLTQIYSHAVDRGNNFPTPKLDFTLDKIGWFVQLQVPWDLQLYRPIHTCNITVQHVQRSIHYPTGPLQTLI